MQLSPYLSFNGRCEEAFKFYEQRLRGKILAMLTYGSSPMADQTPPEWRDKIMHTRLIVENAILMGSDNPPEHYEQMKGMSVCLSIENQKMRSVYFMRWRERYSTNAHPADFLGNPLRHACRSVRNTMDDKLRVI